MKLLIASDLHGSAYYASLVRNAFHSSRAEKLVLLGDLLYHGPRNDLPKAYDPKQVTEILNGMRAQILAIRGNCDSEVDQMVLDFPIMADYGVIADGQRTLYLSHGHRAVPPMVQGSVYLTGHTHIPKGEEADGVLFLNPGSAALPKENSLHSCLFYEDGRFTWFDLDKNEPYFI